MSNGGCICMQQFNHQQRNLTERKEPAR